jgi:hypothetical protein
MHLPLEKKSSASVSCWLLVAGGQQEKASNYDRDHGASSFVPSNPQPATNNLLFQNSIPFCAEIPLL